jgi:DNA-damage-inducible protein J
MAKTDIINTRVEPKLKKSVAKVLKPLGLTTTEAITIFLHQVVAEEGIPFPVKIPNKETQKAMREALAGKNFKQYSSLEEAIRDFK